MCKKIYSLILFFLFTLGNTLSASAPTLSEWSKVSLLTCSSSTEEIYTLFGHSGLRIQDETLGIDVVFDYGIFDFNSDNFIYRFVKGETDYRVGDRRFSHFLGEYSFRGVGITEQVLNLTLTEKQNVLDALIENSLPENRVYRYNFFYDNCSTRPRDIVAKSLEGRIDYIPHSKEQSYRDLLEECLVLTPWSRFGIFLVIGSGADKIIDERQKDFRPSFVLTSFNHANIIDSSGKSRKLVLSAEELIAPEDGALALTLAQQTGGKSANAPLCVGIMLLLAASLVSYLQCKKQLRAVPILFDTFLFLIAGLGGCIIFFLMFFSEHPCVDANWNLMWLNPLPLFFIPFFFVKSLTKYVISYHFVNFALLSLFIVGFAFIPQRFEIAFIPYVLALCVRSGVNVLMYKQTKK